MVNAGDSFRRLNTHQCHKHCINRDASSTGGNSHQTGHSVVLNSHFLDEIGHCQKCKKFNSNDKYSQLPQPTIATKIKKSLISNLGNTALHQMLIMMFCSLALLGASITMAVL